MPVNVSIKAVPDVILDLIRKRAEKNHRSLQGELIVILTEAVGLADDLKPADALAQLENDAWKTDEDGVATVRKDRDAG